MRTRLKSDYRTKYYSFTIDRDSRALIINFKGRWESHIYDEFMADLKWFIGKVDTSVYTLILRCSEFGIPMTELRDLIDPFMKVYRDAGFSHMRVITENPQKLFRQIMGESGLKIGFTMEFCNSEYAAQEVYC